MPDQWAALLHDSSVCETGGEHGNDGVDYARYVAMALLVELERLDTSDYALLFEYLQDIALLDSPSAPGNATLLQVKKKVRGEWTRSSLCRMEVKKALEESTASEDIEDDVPNVPDKKSLGARSALGKLYLCVDRLSTFVTVSGVFISNAGHSLKQSNGAPAAPHSRLEFGGLHGDDVEYIKKKLSGELKQDSLPHFARLAIEQSRISPAAMRETVRGMIDALLSQKYPLMPSVSGRLQERLLAAFSACGGPKPAIQSLSDAVSYKGFTRSSFTKLLKELSSTRSAPDALEAVIEGLKTEGLGPRPADALRAEANRLQIQLLRHPETREALLWDLAVLEAQKHAHVSKYTDIINVVSAELLKRSGARQRGPSSEREAKALALLALIYVDQESAPISTKSASKEK